MNLVQDLAILTSIALPEWEIQGLVSGILVATTSEEIEPTLDRIEELRPGLCEPDALEKFCLAVRNQLTDSDMDLGFELLLPSDEEPLTTKVEALGSWVFAFLEGFNSCSIEKPEDCTEAFEDLEQISEIDAEVEDSNDLENSYLEIAEHARISVLLIYEQIQQSLKA